jgi:pilus assembly protein CpaC
MRGAADVEEEARTTNRREEAEEGEDVMRLRRSWRLMMGLGLSIALLSCGAKEQPELSEESQATLENMEQQGREAMLDAMNQQIIESPAARQQPGAVRLLLPGEPIWLQSGKSRALQLQQRITRVSLGDPEIAGIVVLGPQTIMINAKPLPEVERREERSVSVGRTGTVLGRTLTPEPRLFETTLVIWGPSDEPDIHTLTVADFVDEQVLLEVTVAEVNRTALEEHGIDFRVVQDKLIAAGFMAGGIPVPSTIPPTGNLLPLGIFGADRPTYAFIFPDENVSVLIKTLETEGLATILAQPKVLAMSGQIAVFQVGGEIPIRISSGFAADIEFKPFGTLVNFIPRVTEEGDIFLTVTPEVSEPDFTRTVEGIPTFRTRRASTSAKLREGQTLILGGLLQRITLESIEGVPYLKDIPFLGYAFGTTAYTTEVRELLVTVRPHLVKPIPAGVEVYSPTDRGPLTDEEVRTRKEPAEATRPRLPFLP